MNLLELGVANLQIFYYRIEIEFMSQESFFVKSKKLVIDFFANPEVVEQSGLLFRSRINTVGIHSTELHKGAKA